MDGEDDNDKKPDIFSHIVGGSTGKERDADDYRKGILSSSACFTTGEKFKNLNKVL